MRNYIVKIKKKKKKTTSWRCVECAGSGTRLPGFESVLHLQLSRKTCHTFPIKMGIIIASTSLVIMEIEGTNSQHPLHGVWPAAVPSAGFFSFQEGNPSFKDWLVPRSQLCCRSPQAALTHHVSTWTQLFPVTPSTFLILGLPHHVPSAQNAVVFHVYFFLLSPGSNPQHYPFRALRKPPPPLQAGPSMAVSVSSLFQLCLHLLFLCPITHKQDILHHLLVPVQSYLEQGPSFKNY